MPSYVCGCRKNFNDDIPLGQCEKCKERYIRTLKRELKRMKIDEDELWSMFSLNTLNNKFEISL